MLKTILRYFKSLDILFILLLHEFISVKTTTRKTERLESRKISDHTHLFRSSHDLVLFIIYNAQCTRYILQTTQYYYYYYYYYLTKSDVKHVNWSNCGSFLRRFSHTCALAVCPAKLRKR